MADLTVEPVQNLSPELHNFIFLVGVCMLVLWLVSIAVRSRRLADLRSSWKQKTIVRLDHLNASLRSVRQISRNHLHQLLTSRSKYQIDAVHKLPVAMHLNCKSVKIASVEVDGRKQLALEFDMVCSAPTIVQVYYALRFGGIQALYNSRYKQENEPAEPAAAAAAAAPGSAVASPVAAASSNNNNASSSSSSGGGGGGGGGGGNNNNSNSAASEAQKKKQKKLPKKVATDWDNDDDLTNPEVASRYSESKGALFPPAKYSICTTSRLFLPSKKQRVTIVLNAQKLHGSLTASSYPLALSLVNAADGATVGILPSPSDQAENEYKSLDPPSRIPVCELTMLQLEDFKSAAQGTVDGKSAVPDLQCIEDASFKTRVDSQLMITPHQLLELQDVYGIDDPESLDCTVCLVEKKDIIFLPCRHCCICHQCFENIAGKCPVCRSQIRSFMKFTGGSLPHQDVGLLSPTPDVPSLLMPRAGSSAGAGAGVSANANANASAMSGAGLGSSAAPAVAAAASAPANAASAPLSPPAAAVSSSSS